MIRRIGIVVALCLLAGGCFKPQPMTAAAKVDLGLRVRALAERELMLVDERLQMQALDGTIAGADVSGQLNAAAQQLLATRVRDAAPDQIVNDQKAATGPFFGLVDITIDHSTDPQWRAFAAGRMVEIRHDYADAITKGLDPGPELSSAYVMLARSRGVTGPEGPTPFDNAQADADKRLPDSPDLPPATARPVMPVGG